MAQQALLGIVRKNRIRICEIPAPPHPGRRRRGHRVREQTPRPSPGERVSGIGIRCHGRRFGLKRRRKPHSARRPGRTGARGAKPVTGDKCCVVPGPAPSQAEAACARVWRPVPRRPAVLAAESGARGEAQGDVCGNGAVRQHPRWTAGCSRGRTFPWGGRGSPRDAGSGGGAARSLYRQHPRVVAEGTETAPLRRKDRQLDGGTELTPRPGPQEAPGYGGPYRPGVRTEYSQARLVLRQILGFLLQSQRKANVRERDGRPGTRPARPLRRKHRAAAPGGRALRPRSSGWRWEAHTSA